MFRRLRKGSSRLAGTPYLYIGRELEKLKGGDCLPKWVCKLYAALSFKGTMCVHILSNNL